MIMVIHLDHWILVHFYIFAHRRYILNISIGFINFHLDIILDPLNYSALDTNFVILRFARYSCIWLWVSFSFSFASCLTVYSCSFFLHIWCYLFTIDLWSWHVLLLYLKNHIVQYKCLAQRRVFINRSILLWFYYQVWNWKIK